MKFVSGEDTSARVCGIRHSDFCACFFPGRVLLVISLTALFTCTLFCGWGSSTWGFCWGCQQDTQLVPEPSMMGSSVQMMDSELTFPEGNRNWWCSCCRTGPSREPSDVMPRPVSMWKRQWLESPSSGNEKCPQLLARPPLIWARVGSLGCTPCRGGHSPACRLRWHCPVLYWTVSSSCRPRKPRS